MGALFQSVSGTPGSGFALTASNAARVILVFALLTVSIRAREIYATLAQPKLSASGTRSLESTSAEEDRLQNVGPVLGDPERSTGKIQHSRGDLKAPTTTSSDSSNSPHDQSYALQGYPYRRTLLKSKEGPRSPPANSGGKGGNG